MITAHKKFARIRRSKLYNVCVNNSMQTQYKERKLRMLVTPQFSRKLFLNKTKLKSGTVVPIALTIANLIVSMPCRAASPASLDTASRKIVNDFRTGDYINLANFLSKTSVEAVYRTTDWQKTEDDNSALKTNRHKNELDFDLSGLQSLDLSERVVSFWPPDYKSSTFQRILTQFHGIVATSLVDYPEGLAIDANLTDEFQIRHLGPAIKGKVCAGSWWYICLAREDGHWRIWRLERDDH